MKTTSYEISKQLAEAGFKGETEFGYDKSGQIDYAIWNNSLIHTKAYDLETILEALPKQHDFFSRGIGNYELRIWYHENKVFIGYQNFDGFDKLLTFEQEENESLADTAARLWLKLKKENLI